MRGRQFAAFLILVMNLIFLCTACQSAGNEAENSSGAAGVTGAAEDSGEDDDQEKNNGESVSQQDETAATESVKRMRYEKVPAELTAFRCVGEAQEDILWQEARLITSYAELETFRSEVSGIWTGTEGQKRMEQFRSLADSYHSGSFETKALIGVFVKQDNWDYEHKVKLVRDNELNLLEVTVTAERPEEEDYPQECFWLLLLEVDSAEIKDIKETVVAVKNEIDTDKIVVSSDVVTIPGGALDSSEPVIAESAAELQALGESAGVADTLEWKIMTRNYMESESRQEENLIIAVSAAAPVGLTEYDARVVVDEWTGELSVDVFYCQREDAVVFDAVESRLILIELKRSALENVKEIRRDSIAVTYNKEDLAAWGIPYGIQEKLMAIHEADLDHDGEKEQIALCYRVGENVQAKKISYVQITVLKEEKYLWTEWLSLRSSEQENNIDAYYLYRENGKDYLLICGKNAYEREEYSSRFEICFVNEDGFFERKDRDSVWARWDQYRIKEFPISADELTAFSERLNGLLADSVCICYIENDTLYCAPPNGKVVNEPYYEENFDLLFSDEVYSDCGTIAEKVDVFNQTLKEKWFVDGEIPEMPEEYRTLMAELMLEVRPNMIAFKNLVNADRSLLFEDYNGEELQFVEEPDYEASTPLSYPGKIYYRPEGELSPEEVAQYMAEALMQHLVNDFPGQEFVIEKYRLEEPSLTSWDDIVNSYTNDCWIEYLNEYRGVQDNLLEYAKSWVEERFSGDTHVLSLEDDMWYFILDGYYRYEGGIPTFEQRGSWGERMQDGMVSLHYGDGMYTGFVLVKYGDVYGLQKGWRWGK